MAFWGIEVKPGKPFTHSFDGVRGRLRISQATLGIGSSTKTSLVQCNVGDKSPVFLCALLPDKTESCHLELEFEEADEVIFSVIGPRSVYLTGYYLCNGRHPNLNDDSESYGEDIANTETEQSTPGSDEDGYDDSFIDDGDFEVFPPSPISNDRVVDEELLDKKKPKRRKSIHKRLKKNYQSIESDDDNNSQQKNIVNECKGVSGLASEDEDNFPISFLHESSRTEAGDKVDMEISKTGNKKTEDGGSHAGTEDDGTRIIDPKSRADAIAVDGEPKRGMDLPCGSLLHSDGVGSENDFELRKEKKEKSLEGKTLKADGVNCYNALKEDKLQYTQENTDGISLDLLVTNKQDQKPAADKESDLPYHSLPPSNGVGFENQTKSKKKRKERTGGKTLESGIVKDSNSLKDHKVLQDKTEDQKPATEKETDWCLPSAEDGSENGAKRKKRRKEFSAEGKSVEGIANYNNVLKEDKMKQNGEAGKSGKDHPMRSVQDQKFSSVKSIDIDSNQVADGDQSEEDKKTKKKKKKSKMRENEGNMNIDVPSLPAQDKNAAIMGFEDKNMETKSSQARTLSNGLIIEDLEMGKPDGKIAAPGKKVKVHYIGKLRENGQIFDSNIGKAPFKFRLGDENVIEGWNIGLNGMRIGDKRRLIIPPLMGYGSQGAGENIPPNSWLVYEVELVGIH